MNIHSFALNGRFLTRPPTGVDRFAAEIVRAWMAAAGADKLTTLVPADVEVDIARLPGADIRAVGKRDGHVWEQLELPRELDGKVLLNLCNTAPLMLQRQLVVLHDAATLANPANFSFAFRAWYRLLFAGLMRRSQLLATVSKFSADELTRYFGSRKLGVEVIYEGGEHVLRHEADRAVLQRFDLQDKPFVLAVGSRTPNKNFAGLVAASKLLKQKNITVVAAGGSNSRVFADAEIDADNLVLTGYISDGELRALYESASCFVFPSFYEGFGLPPLEAMNCGCPVIASNRASMPEVCGAAARYCDPDDPADIAQQIERVLESASLREELRGAGYERARLFTWDKAAAHFSDILQANFA